MTDCNEAMRPVHDRMPVLPHQQDYDVWLTGSIEDVMSFQGRCYPDELISVERTLDPWIRRPTEVLA
jgi:putative SOS response-associated peptidase YedK